MQCLASQRGRICKPITRTRNDKRFECLCRQPYNFQGTCHQYNSKCDLNSGHYLANLGLSTLGTAYTA